MRTLAGRVVVLATVVAVAASALTAVLLARALAAGNRDRAAAVLVADAQNLAEQVGSDRPLVRLTAARRLRRQGYVVELVPAGRPPATPPFTTADVPPPADPTSAPTPAPAERTAGGSTWLVVGRPVAGGGAVLVARPLDGDLRLTPAQRRQALFGAAAGLAVGALAGLVLARGVSRPLARVAVAARRLTAGEREVRVPPEGPREVADVAVALDGLATALRASEERRRRFLLDVSHELRTPLTAVAGYAEALADGVLQPDEVVAAGEVVRAEAARLQRRVEDLLALARLEADDFRIEATPTDVGAVVRGAAAALAPRAAAADVPVRLEVPPSGPVAVTDGERLRQAVDALADNALRVLPPGAPLVLAASAGGGTVRVEVRDGGPGLTPDDLAVAFERGALARRYRGDRPVGSGLGLALVAELARRLGGRAGAHPAPEGGAAFRIVLPLPSASAEAAARRPHEQGDDEQRPDRAWIGAGRGCYRGDVRRG